MSNFKNKYFTTYSGKKVILSFYQISFVIQNYFSFILSNDLFEINTIYFKIMLLINQYINDNNINNNKINNNNININNNINNIDNIGYLIIDLIYKLNNENYYGSVITNYDNIIKMKSQHLSIKLLPKKPGIYKFLSKKGEILYIGKATDLSSRVRSYFSKDLIVTRGPLLVDMVTLADHVEYIKTDTVLEALLLEAELIKKHLPKYNTKEKDNKSFLCVVITDEPLPQVLQIRKKDIDFVAKAAKLKTKNYKLETVYGPFTSGSQLREAMKIIRRIFPYIDTSSAKRDNYEFYRQLGLTPDTTDIKVAIAYREVIKNIKLFFEGKKKKIITNLKKEMLGYAKAKQFEQANEIKRRIFALEHINDTALIKDDFFALLETSAQSLVPFRIEAYDVAHTSGKEMVGVMVVLENGEINKNEYRQFNIKTVSGANDPASLAEIITRRLGHATWELPQIIVVDGNEIQKKTAEKIIKTKGFTIPVVAVVKDEKHRPKELLGERALVTKHNKAILLANSEAHRFSIGLHRKKRGKNFLSK